MFVFHFFSHRSIVSPPPPKGKTVFDYLFRGTQPGDATRREALRLLNLVRAEFDHATGILYLTSPPADPRRPGRALVLRPGQSDQAAAILNGDFDDEEEEGEGEVEDDDARRARREARLLEVIKAWRCSPTGGGCKYRFLFFS